MNILLINYEYPPVGGGAGNATFYLGKELAKMENQVYVLTSSYKKWSGWEELDGVKIYRCKSLRRKAYQSNVFEMLSFIFSASLSLGKIIRTKKIVKIIVFFTIPCGPVGYLAKILYKVPYIVSLRGGDVPGTEPGLKYFYKFLQPFRRLILKNSMGIIANSEGLRQLAEKADPYKVSIIPNGVDHDYFSPLKDNREIQKQQTYEFIFVGRFQPQKNLFFLLEAIKLLKISTHKPFRLLLVGDGYLKEEILDFISNNALEEVVTIQGWQDKSKVRELYLQSDCFVITSLYEGLSNVVLEAMACGLPVIASNVAGNNELVRHDLNGFLFGLDNMEELVSSMKILIENSKQSTLFGKESRKIIEEKYNWRITATKYQELLK
jgi:glycosyltransferase involved in cell wall biosynthesis